MANFLKLVQIYKITVKKDILQVDILRLLVQFLGFMYES